ncbi:peptide/nickel transport system substrate-binding protein [Neorhizobium galegae]|uniref:ABC transporter substrate-binding protein n=1 Tax=Neorhizobium galegae TaxID=399 RepID=UPI0027896BC6|nr:ABC transporter substrate-binding protein [Neorhizobium galegae]MDQ0137796.1 peptide/nickel transport system substrate-binding protein [Neorhizobium galegae]
MSKEVELEQIRVTRRALLAGTAGIALSLTIAAALPEETRAAESTLRVAATGSNADSLDPHRTQGQITDIVRFTNLFDGLTEYNPDASVALVLAESFTPNADASEWTVKLRSGVKTHDGKAFGADDVIFSVKRILDKSNPTKGSALIKFIDPEAIAKLDDLTLVFKLKAPYGPFADVWANRYLRMVPVGFDPAKAIGTGPFKLVSFTPGRESVFERFDDYFREKAKVAKLSIVNISDAAASINALRGGQVDMTYKIPFAEARIIEADPAIKLLNNPSSMAIPIYMRTDAEPFNDVRVRQAFRLIANREQMVKVALAGYGSIGNDMQGRSIAPCGPTPVAQRKQDIEAAKKLLKEAGKEGMSIDLVTVNGTAGMVECAQVFAEQAKAAGVKINVKITEEAAYLANYGKWTFGVDFLSDAYLPVVARSLLPGGTFNTSHWDDKQFNELYQKAVSIPKAEDRCTVIHQMQQIEYERGGNLLWGFANTLNAYKAGLTGIVPYVVDSPFYHLRKVALS